MGGLTTLKLHKEAIHSGERKHICPICGTTYKTKPCLQLHISLQHEERQVKCDFKYENYECKAAFVSKRDLKRHSVLHDRELEKLNDPQTYPFRCDQCLGAFKNKWIAKEHAQVKLNPN